MSLKAIRETLYTLDDELQNTDDIKENIEKLYREIGTLNEADLKKRCTI